MELRDRLSSRGIDVWTPDLVPAGELLSEESGRALDASDAMVVLISPAAMESPYIQNEISYALGSPRFEGRLIPVELRPSRAMPWVLRELSIIKADDGMRKAGDRIAKKLNDSAGARHGGQ